MRANKHKQRATEGLLKFLEKAGVSADTIAEVKDTVPTDRDIITLEAEGVLLSLQKAARFMTKKCKREACGEMFGTNYRSVAYCSDNCRAKELERQTGLKWNPHKPQGERWGSPYSHAEPPMVIGPQALEAMVAAAKNILLLAGETPPEKTQNQNSSPLPQQVVEGQQEELERTPEPQQPHQSSPHTNLQTSPAQSDAHQFDFDWKF